MIGNSCPGALFLRTVSHVGRLLFVPPICYMHGAQSIKSYMVVIIRRRPVVYTCTTGGNDEIIKLPGI